MGCVLGTEASRNRRKSAGNQPRRRRSVDGPPGAVDANVAVTVRKEATEQEKTSRTIEVPAIERRKPRPDPCLRNQQGWPSWLMAVAGEAIQGWTPRRANTFEKLAKIGQGTYSNVYKARDLITGKIVALKKVRFDNLEPESVKFMAREILVLRKLDHPNVVKLEGLVTSRMSCSLYLVFEYMEHDLAGLAAYSGVKFTEPQVKCYMKQLLSGLEHCHSNGVLHRDIKVELSPYGTAPELLLGATSYGVGVDIWSAGCILAELLAGKPIMPGRTEQPYKRCVAETFKDFPPSPLPLIESLLSIDPDERGTATTALNGEFTKYPPSKEMDVKLRDEEARRQRGLSGKANAVDGVRRVKVRERVGRAIPAPEANAEIQANLDRWRVVTQTNAKSKSEKFPPPHQDGAVGYPQHVSHKGPLSFGAPDASFGSSGFNSRSSGSVKSMGAAAGGSSRRRKTNREDPLMAPSRKFIRAFKPSSVGLSMNLLFKSK
ncbi:hypothetical protein FNV43_RR19544 [Rhamnella rubrinervis]|uniref:Protein kinase domain-containing protein n=1 Tax=Rhamnella rubrinervis TaxID=2594499 RepID=A0A8K0DU91_9ROSA|nr:hypothetical protein FNV43_RR19544 [Rhamnella rubrinervis]